MVHRFGDWGFKDVRHLVSCSHHSHPCRPREMEGKQKPGLELEAVRSHLLRIASLGLRLRLRNVTCWGLRLYDVLCWDWDHMTSSAGIEIIWRHLLWIGIIWRHMLQIDITWRHMLRIDITWCHLLMIEIKWCHLLGIEISRRHLLEVETIWFHLLGIDFASHHVLWVKVTEDYKLVIEIRTPVDEG